MSLMSDGTNKVFLLKHDMGAMNLEGFKGVREMARAMLYRSLIANDPIEQLKQLESIVDEVKQMVKDDWSPKPACDCGDKDCGGPFL